MKLSILMRKNWVDDSVTAALMTEAANWFARELLNPFQIELLGKVQVAMRQKATLGCLGKCANLNWADYEGRPKDFRLSVARDQVDYWKVRTLAHEFVHLKQRVEGRLTYRHVDGAKHPFWKGKDVHGVPYEKLPYEIEADAMEGPLAERFLIEVKGWRAKRRA